MRYRLIALLALSLSGSLLALSGCTPIVSRPAAMRDEGGWHMLVVQGSPYQLGLQHALALAPQIDDAIRENIASAEQPGDDDPAMTWAWARRMAMEVLEPKVPADCRAELQGLADGLKQRGFNYDYADLLAYNGVIDLVYYFPEWRKAQGKTAAFTPPERCSAFIAAGDMTADGGIIAAHNTWSSYVDGQRFNVILDVRPDSGHRFVMDTQPGFIHSASDWFINDAGIILTETTIGDFEGFDPKGIPEFVRARHAIQYSSSIDDVYSHFVKGNNGGYANTWLFGDTKTGEIAKLELGLKNVIFHRSTQGAYWGSNFPEDAKFIAEECPKFVYDADDGTEVRRARWIAVLAANKGKLDAETAKQFMADCTDARTGALGATSCTLCGRADLVPDSKGKLRPSGASNAKVTTTALARDLRFWAKMGFPDDSTFNAKAFLDAPDREKYQWQRPFLWDIPAQPWVMYSAR